MSILDGAYWEQEMRKKKVGDRIRQMSNNELAKTIARRISLCYGCEAENERDCVPCLEGWLEREMDK